MSQLADSRDLREFCRAQISRAQWQAGQQIEELLALNWQVRSLKAERKRAEAALRTATESANPAAIAAATAWLAGVKQRQIAARIKQEVILAAGQGTLTTARMDVSGRVHSSTLAHRSLYRLSVEGPPVAAQGLAVKAVPPLDSYPEYELEKSFTEKQALELNWQMKFTLNSEGVMKWFPPSYQIEDGCGATLTREGGRFKVKFHQARFFWNM
ncbi:MAG: hypothetical protein C5B49_10665 [Bdellovibrio sp.]|nr:MAG: hypothetical protein C5B49_10665 [Bdellovibrio sp.]